MQVAAAVVIAALASHGGLATATEGGGREGVASAKVRVVILGLRNDGVDDSVVSQVVDALALRISRSGKTEVLTATDIEAVLGLEATRQALDCDEGSCAAMDEITRALDVRYTIGGSIAPRSEGFYVHASLVDVAEGRAVARSGALVNSDDYASALGPVADELVAGLFGEDATPKAAAPVTTTEAGASGSPPGLPLISWIGVGVTGIASVVGGVGGVLWAVDDGTIRDETSPFAVKKGARDRYLVDQAILASGATVAAFGVAMIVAGFAMGE